ncbi:MAG: PorV/PorQ family protein [Bacteroidota bacterium]|nr:PorV/PorQ family protein [Bacteroidota bacterium]
MAQTNAETGLPFLKLGIGARSIAMGEAYAAIAEDASSMFYNPGALAFSPSDEILLMHKQWILQTSTEYLGSVFHSGELAFGVGINSTGVSAIEIREKPGPAEGTFSQENAAINGTISYRITPEFGIGASAKLLYEKIYVDEASGEAFDFGAFYKAGSSLDFGASLSNIGSMNALRYEATTLPTMLRVGAAFHDNVTNEITTVVDGDVMKVFKDDGTRIHLGGEASYDNIVAFRAGYQFGYDAKGFSAGFGVSAFGELVQFDYAYVPFTNDLGSTHTFSLTFRF